MVSTDLLLLFIAVCVIALAVAIWVTWRIQIPIWLIPANKIRAEAEALVKAHGDAAGHQAAKLELKAYGMNDHFEAGKWARVASWLRHCDRKKRGSTDDHNVG